MNTTARTDAFRAQPHVSVTTYSVQRLTVDVPGSAADFRRRYEAAVPPYPEEEVMRMVARRAPWDEMLSFIGRVAPFGFLIYGTTPADAIMGLAGDEGSSVAYLMGNHTIAEKMFRHDPSVMLHVPLRTAIWSRGDGQAKFTLDRPSDLLGSYGNTEVSKVGVELDLKVAALLEHLQLSVPAQLRTH